MSNLPEFLQGKSCFDGRPSPSVSEEFLREFYAKEKERRKHMRECHGCGKWFTPKRSDQIYHNKTCKQQHLSRLYQQQKTQDIQDELLLLGGVL